MHAGLEEIDLAKARAKSAKSVIVTRCEKNESFDKSYLFQTLVHVDETLTIKSYPIYKTSDRVKRLS